MGVRWGMLLLGLGLLSACTVVPTGPSVLVLPAVGKSMVTRSTSANKRLEFRAALHNGARSQLHRPPVAPIPASPAHAPTLFKVLR